MTVGNFKELGFIKLYELAFKNTKNSNPSFSEQKIDRYALSNAFHWSDTSEGRNFWAGLSKIRMNDRPKDNIIRHLKSVGYDSLCEVTLVYKNGVLVQRNGLFG